MIAADDLGDEWLPRAQCFEIREFSLQRIESVSNERKQNPPRAPRSQRVESVGELLTRERLILKIDTGEAIDLKVEECWGERHAAMKAQFRRGKSLGK
jgi:hypothetical protein